MADANENLVPCPCCGEGLVEANHEFDICDVCGWEDDDYQFNNPDYRGGANRMSLNEARRAYKMRRENKNVSA